MISDYENRFDQAETAITGPSTVTSAKCIDLGSATGITMDNPPDYFVEIDRDYVAGTSINFRLVAADDTALTTNVVVLAESGVVALASLLAGTMPLSGKLPRKITKRYLGLQVISLGTFTGSVTVGGAFTAGLTSAVPIRK